MKQEEDEARRRETEGKEEEEKEEEESVAEKHCSYGEATHRRGGRARAGALVCALQARRGCHGGRVWSATIRQLVRASVCLLKVPFSGLYFRLYVCMYMTAFCVSSSQGWTTERFLKDAGTTSRY